MISKAIFNDNFARQVLNPGPTLYTSLVGSAFTLAGDGRLNLGAKNNLMRVEAGQIYNPIISFECCLSSIHAAINLYFRASDATHNLVLNIAPGAFGLYIKNTTTTLASGGSFTGLQMQANVPFQVTIDIQGALTYLYLNGSYVGKVVDGTWLRAGYIYLESQDDGTAVTTGEGRCIRNMLIRDRSQTAPTTPTGTLFVSGAGAGLLLQKDFSNLTGATNEGTWALDATVPTYVCYPSQEMLVFHGVPGEMDGGGIREPQLVVTSTGRRYIYGDNDGDGGSTAPTNAWVPSLLSSDNMLSWNKLANLVNGLQKGDLSGNWAGRGGSGWLYKVAGVWYLNTLDAAATTGNAIPSTPYTDSWYSNASSIEGQYTFTGNGNALGLGAGGAFDHDTASASCIVKIGSTYYNYYSALLAGSPNQYQVGLASSSSPFGPWTKIGAQLPGAITSLISGQVLENPKVWYSTALSKWVMQLNGSNTGNNQAVNRFLFSSTAAGTLPDWSAAVCFVYQPRQCEYDGAGQNGVLCPFTNEDGTFRQSSDGSLGAVYDGQSTAADGNTLRNYLQAELRAAPNGVRFNNPGASNNQKTLSFPLVHTDFVAEYTLDIASATGDCSFAYRRGAGTGDAAAAYWLSCAYAAAPVLYYWNGASATLVATASGALNRFALANTVANQSITVEPNRLKIVVKGSRHQVYLDGCLVIDVTDASAASGTNVGFRANKINCIVRQLNISQADQVTISGLVPEQVVTLRGIDDVVLAVGTVPAGATTITLHSRHWPATGLQIDTGATYKPAAGIWGGDTLAATITAASGGGTSSGGGTHHIGL